MRPLRTLPVLIVCLVLVASCASTTLLSSGEALDSLGKQFVATGQQLDVLHTQRVISDADYRTWAVFVPKFKAAYREATQAWLTAYKAGASDTPEKVIQLLTDLKNQLLEFVIRLQAAKGVPQ